MVCTKTGSTASCCETHAVITDFCTLFTIVFMGGQTIQPRDPVAIALKSFCSVIAMTALLSGDSSGHQSETASDAESVSMS